MEKSLLNDRLIHISDAAPVDMADEWYEFANVNHFWMEWRFQSIFNSPAFFRQKPGRWLDIGCGHGEVIKQFESKGDYIIDGCDLNLMALQQTGTIRGNIYVYDIFDLSQELIGKYTGIFLLDVIEHIDDESAFLDAGLKHLQPGGIVVINVPALSGLFSEYDVVAGHKRRYNKKMLEELFKKNGLEILEINYWGFSLLPIALVRKFLLLFIPRKNIIRRGFKPPGSWVNSLFKLLMKVERKLMSHPPIGTSLVAIGQKP